MNEKEKDDVLQTARRGRIFGTDPTMTHLNVRLVTVPEYCGWCGYHREGNADVTLRCPRCSGNSWLPCHFDCIHERIGAKAEIVTDADLAGGEE